MTEQITILTPSLIDLGLQIQNNVLKGYRLVDGYPNNCVWQFEAIMEKKDLPEIPMPSSTVSKPVGRPKGSGK